MIGSQRGNVLLQQADDQFGILTILSVVEHVHGLLAFSSSSPLPAQFGRWDYEGIVGSFIVPVSEHLGISAPLESFVDDELIDPDQFPAIVDLNYPSGSSQGIRYEKAEQNAKPYPRRVHTEGTHKADVGVRVRFH